MKPIHHIPVDTRAHMRLLATSDLHMHLTGYDYHSDRTDVSVGLTRTAGLIHAARGEAEATGTLTLLFDNGDSLQGTPLGDLAVRDLDQDAGENRDQVHPLMLAFEHLRYDAIGLGNHDFNFGLAALLKVVANAPCPVVGSNLYRRDGDDLKGIAPFAIFERTVQAQSGKYPIRIGVLSFLPPQTVQWDAHLLQGAIAVDDILCSARHRVAELRQAGCEVVVVLAHSGLDDGPAHEGMENAVQPLAAMDGIDAVIAGHTHLHLPGADHAGLEHVNARTGAVHGTPVVMPGTAGSHLGVIDLGLKANRQGRWEVSGFDCALRPVSVRGPTGALQAATDEDGVLCDILKPCHVATRSSMHRSVGRTDYPLHSYFTFFAPDRALALVAAAQAAALRLVLSGTKSAGLPLLSAAAPCKFGARSGPLHYTDVPEGEILLRHVADLHVFPNELRAVIVSGRQLLDWLERSAALFHQIAPGSGDTPLIRPSVPGHDFDVLHGLTWQVDLSAPSRFDPDGSPLCNPEGRIGDLRMGNRPVTPDQRFVVALNNYRAGGGGNFSALKDAEHLPVPPVSIRSVICDYLSSNLPPDPLQDATPAWRFKPMPGSSVTAQTGPGARAYLDELGARDITVCGPGADGFLRLRLPL